MLSANLEITLCICTTAIMCNFSSPFLVITYDWKVWEACTIGNHPVGFIRRFSDLLQRAFVTYSSQSVLTVDHVKATFC